ncbi:MAG: ricin-type beta-trefoil lectin domain protein, partial [Deltaproteobacteria bacterium]|nr:ricin-type beta-trefoil lectin domain protein [Deltaproteobacteria bacterium]
MIVRSTPALALSVALLGCGGEDITADKTDSGVDDGTRLVVGVGGKCLDANGTTPTDGALTILWSCHGGSNQRWRLDPVTSEIRGYSGKCLDVAGAGGEGASVILYGCHGGANQKWTHDPATGQSKGLGGLCLDVEGG